MYTILTYSRDCPRIGKINITSQTIDISFLYDVRCSHGKHVAGVLDQQLMASCQHRRLEKACFHVVLSWLLAPCRVALMVARQNDLGRRLGIMEAEDRRFRDQTIDMGFVTIYIVGARRTDLV
jgi:hypothetical protein